MLREIRIENLLLVKSCTVAFHKGFNVLSGESGAGKSALIQALAVALGERTDASLVRSGAASASVEAAFALPSSSPARAALAQLGLPDGDLLIVRRVISRAGKSRSSINGEPVRAKTLRLMAPHLIDRVGQHAHLKLLFPSTQRRLMDLFADSSEEADCVQQSWARICSLRERLASLLSQESKRLRELDVCRMELSEMDGIDVKEGEEEALFTEMEALSHKESQFEATRDVRALLEEGRLALLPLLVKIQQKLEKTGHPPLMQAAASVASAHAEMEEVSYAVHAFLADEGAGRKRLGEVETRLKCLQRFQRKYGQDFQALLRLRAELVQKIDDLENFDDKVAALRVELQEEERRCDAACRLLSCKRSEAAPALEAKVTKELQELNMPGARFYVRLSPCARNECGDERVDFLFSPNVGEVGGALKECASGGELSRLLLSLKTVLLGKEPVATLVFDEIDAGIGGETATAVGKKIRRLAAAYQILCITHLPQVALLGEHHLRIVKSTVKGRTYTTIRSLQLADRQKELARMLGGKAYGRLADEWVKTLLPPPLIENN